MFCNREVNLMIKMEKVSFSYKSEDKIQVSDLIIEIKAGEFVLLCGKSGCGDSDIMMTDTINPLKSKFKASTKLLNKTI